MATHQNINHFATEHLQSDLKGRSVRGGVVTLGAQVVQFATLTTSTIVLAHLLTPRDFGLYAMVTAITGFGQAFADLGLSEATIQRPDIDHQQVSNLFWVNVAIGLGLMIVANALAPLIAWFYREPQVRNIVFSASPIFLIGGLRVQHDALIKRQMRFMALAIRDTIACAVAVPVAIAMAMHGAGYWAIVALPLVLNFVVMAQSWLIVRWRPGLPRRGAGVRGMITFGGNVAASYVILNASRSVDSILIGWYWGAGPLGLYSRAFNLLMIPIRQFSGPAFSVAVPGLSIIQSDRERLARFYLRAVSLLVWIATPVFGFLFVGAGPVILLALGRRWGGAAPIFELLVLGALGQLLLQPTIWLMVSRGESRRLRNLFFFIALILIVGYAVGLPFGIKGVALMGSAVLMSMLPWVLKFTYRGTVLTLEGLGRVVLCPVLLCIGSIALAKVILNLWSPPEAPLQLVVIGLCFAAVYAIAFLIPAARNDFMTILSVFRNRERTEAMAAGKVD
jgi:O-antigen/teichoic acid export membrane protein